MTFEALYDEIRQHASDEFPRECCGLIVAAPAGAVYRRCRNRSIDNGHFILHEEDYAACEDEGEVLAVVHSHPNESANPSMADRAMCAQMNLPWLIVGWPSGVVVVCEPDGYHPPLIGREFSHGVLDCYSLVRDYFKEVCSIEIPNFERHDGWWEQGLNLYLDNFEKAGFVKVLDQPRAPDELQMHDVTLMQVLSNTVNHAAVYVGDSKIIHHLYNRESCYDVYGGYWLRHTFCVVRHRSLVK